MSEPTCGPAIDRVVRALQGRADLPPIQIIGGNGSAALSDERTVIDLEAGIIEAPASCDLPRFRPNGTLRDLDALVLSTDRGEIERVTALADEVAAGELAVSMFGLKTEADLARQRAQPLRSAARVFLGDRYITVDRDVRGALVAVDGFKALYPFQAALTLECLETFQLSVGGGEAAPTAHPGATILNYLTRSISGVRAKDLDKVRAMTENVLTRYPAVREWLLDGPGRHQFELARLLHSVGRHRRQPGGLELGGRIRLSPYTPTELRRHPGFMAADRGAGTQRAVIALSRLKATALTGFESNPTVVTLWQRHVETRVRRIIHNDL